MKKILMTLLIVLAMANLTACSKNSTNSFSDDIEEIVDDASDEIDEMADDFHHELDELEDNFED